MSIEEVLAGTRRTWVEQGEVPACLAALPDDSVDLVFGSPPYMDARTYGIGAVYTCEEWVDFMLAATAAAVRVSRGLVLWVATGVQRDKCYWPGCEGLMWEWYKRGNHLWRPCVWWKVDEDEGGSGIPGSGGKQWLRNDWEYVMAFKKDGWLPWADPLVMGHEPIVPHLGGEMSNRTQDGRRINARTGDRSVARQSWNDSGTNRRPDGSYKKTKAMYTRNADGTRDTDRGEEYGPPKIANPGNCIIVKSRVGGGHMGNRLCHENEAPFPESLAEFFVLSFCPPGGVVLDPFSGSGTTVAMALRHGRRGLGFDLRPSQVELSRRRIATETPSLFGATS